MVTRETLLADGLRSLGFAESVVGEALPKLLEYGRLLEDVAIPRGYVAPGESGRIVERHVLESSALAQFLPRAGSLVDVGSGAGLPGVVLAVLRDSPVIIIEAQKARVAFVRSALRTLELDRRVEIVTARAEIAGRSGLRECADAATARALADLPVALELVLPLVRPGGRAVFSAPALPAAGSSGGRTVQKGRSPAGECDSASEMDRADPSLAPDPADAVPGGAEASSLLGGGTPRRRRFEVPGSKEARWVMTVDKLRPTPDRYPRPLGP